MLFAVLSVSLLLRRPEMVPRQSRVNKVGVVLVVCVLTVSEETQCRGVVPITRETLKYRSDRIIRKNQGGHFC